MVFSAAVRQREALFKKEQAKDLKKLVYLNHIFLFIGSQCIQIKGGKKNLQRMKIDKRISKGKRLIANVPFKTFLLHLYSIQAKMYKGIEEMKVDKAAQNLMRYKVEAQNVFTAAIKMRDEEAKYTDLHLKYMQDVDIAEKLIREANEEADRLEKELKTFDDSGTH